MYGPSQIIVDTDTKKVLRIDDVWDTTQYPMRDSHLVYACDPKKIFVGDRDKKALERAQAMLDSGELVIPPKDPDHCADCGNWYTNPPRKEGLWRGRQAPACEDEEHFWRYQKHYVTKGSMKVHGMSICLSCHVKVPDPNFLLEFLSEAISPRKGCDRGYHKRMYEEFKKNYVAKFGLKQFEFHYR